MSSDEPRLLEQIRDAIRVKHYSPHRAGYLHWAKRYVLFHGKRHPRDLGAEHLAAFVTHLAVKSNVAASTQNQALNGMSVCGCASRTSTFTINN